jgi:hypothetical protein
MLRAPGAGTHAIRQWRQKITSSRRTQRGERAAVVQRGECNDDAHQDARRGRGWRSARHERLRSEREIIREILPILIVRPLHPLALRPKNSTYLFVATYWIIRLLYLTRLCPA